MGSSPALRMPADAVANRAAYPCATALPFVGRRSRLGSPALYQSAARTIVQLFGTRPRGLISSVLYAFLKPMPPRGIRSMSATGDQIPVPLELLSFLDSIPTMTWSALADGSVDFFNQAFRDYVGLSPDQLYGLGWKSGVHREDIQQLEIWWQNLRQSQEAGTTEVRLRRSDGEYRSFQVSAAPIHDERSNLIRWYGINIDIDDHKRAEQKLWQSEVELRTIADAIRQFVVVLAPDGTTLYANRVSLENIGFALPDFSDEKLFTRAGMTRPASVPGEPAWNQVWWLAAHPDDREHIRAERQEAFLRGIAFEMEARLRFKTGQYRWQLFQYNPLKDESGQIIRWYVTATDIDDRKRMEEQLRNENVVLREEIDRSSMFEEIVGSSKPIHQVLKHVEKVAPSDSTVLILGETGTGKELIAHALHRRSKRANRAFIRVNCAAIPQSLIASELFGHEKGAFTGALQRRVGRFEAANGGTLFLDEIGELSMETQIALLRVLQERQLERVGSNHPISVDVRMIAATNRNLPAAVAAGTFRQDLFYRLNVFPITVPPLCERSEDIPLLVEYFVGRFAKDAGKNIRHIGKRTLEQLQSYHWPGNIRELQNVVERAVILCETDTFVVDESWLESESEDSSQREGKLALKDPEVETIKAVLAETHGRISGPSGAATKLGMPRTTLESKLLRLGIDKYGQKRPTSK
jgi:PAS domain S-box-containing protein